MLIQAKMIMEILESIDEAVHVIDHQGFTVYYNGLAAKHDGLNIQEVLGKHLLEVFPSLTEHSSTLLRVVKTGKPIYHLPQSYKNKRGMQIDTINTTVPIFDKGEIIGAVEIAKDYSKLKLLSNKLIDLQGKVKRKNMSPNEVLGARYTLEDIITINKHFLKVLEQGMKVAKSTSTVLIYGETGTGKELFVQAIHSASPRKHAAFIAQNCGALPETLLESILFGTVKGSYTGAVDRAGLFELAHGGTLFLDEINSMPIELQTRLLRVLEDGMVRRIGSTKAFQVDVRVIVAMNKPPEECLKDKELRADLFYRLNVSSLSIPPLRERKEDIPILIKYYIDRYNQTLEKDVSNINDELMKSLTEYIWPGNVRELKHMIEHCMNMVDGHEIMFEHMPVYFQHTPKEVTHSESIKPLRQVLEETEKNLITEALKLSSGNVKKASQLLQIPRQTLQYKIQKLLKNDLV
ncbi:sigma-54 interaction domain-containing protein [Litchfieldia alkalitelluris]|uniref:sigma-54 interaction domain-containing protein n=1 Tax=Litchfieldia alkalitelluris TaxID=304268 RepID=UPI0009985795|nr:sigma 54-interacting transcriptional regulator [Litchfieldia alkalitelluris]